MILGIYSASGGGKETFDLANEINIINQNWDEIVFIDDTKPSGSSLWGYPIYSFDELVTRYSPEEIEIIIGVGEPSDRELLYHKVLNTGYKLTTLIHPTVPIHPTTIIGKGVIISRNAYISCEVVIEDNVRIMPMAIIGHNVIINKHSAISGHSEVGGYSHVGERTFLGFNVCVREHTTIGDDVVVSVGSAVLKDLPNLVVAQGNPARVILKREEGGRVFKKIKGINC